MKLSKRLFNFWIKLTSKEFEVHYYWGNKRKGVSWREAKQLAKQCGGDIYHTSSDKKLTSYYSLNELV